MGVLAVVLWFGVSGSEPSNYGSVGLKTVLHEALQSDGRNTRLPTLLDVVGLWHCTVRIPENKNRWLGTPCKLSFRFTVKLLAVAISRCTRKFMNRTTVKGFRLILAGDILCSYIRGYNIYFPSISEFLSSSQRASKQKNKVTAWFRFGFGRGKFPCLRLLLRLFPFNFIVKILMVATIWRTIKHNWNSFVCSKVTFEQGQFPYICRSEFAPFAVYSSLQ